MRVLICGGGVIGASIARFLALRGAEVVVIERHEVAGAASGHAGGFLALDWCDGSPLAPLARRSFQLHAELAAAPGAEWGYRPLETLAIATSARRRLAPGRHPDLPGWVAPHAHLHQRLGGPATTAQVEPAAFTRAMLQEAQAHGARLLAGEVQGPTRSPDGGRATGVVVDGTALEGEAVVLALGPWTAQAVAWPRLPRVEGYKGHSLLFRGDPSIGAHALFVEHEAEDGSISSPEVYPRADGTVYLSGLPGTLPLPADPAAVAAEEGARSRLLAMARHIAPALTADRLIACRACYRPMARDGLPLLGPVPGLAGAFVATGHSVWGILNAPASGEAMAELVLDGRTRAVDLRAFDPARRQVAGR
jgi:glycine/D-amino acid oxidase-like deaminating enzyme